MQLLNFHIQNFKAIVNKDLEFSKNLVFISGNNEAGKTTIMQAMFVWLFIDSSVNRKLVQKYTNILVEEKHKVYPKLSAEFIVDNVKYYLEKDFELRKTTFRMFQENKWIDTNPQRLEKIVNLNKELYLSTIFTSSIDILNIEDSVWNNLDSLTIDFDFSKSIIVLDKLRKDIAEYKRGLDRPVKIPGIIKTRQDNYLLSYDKNNVLKEKWGEYNKLTDLNKNNASILKEIEEKINNREKLVENYSDFSRSQEQLKNVEVQIQNILGLKKNIKTLLEDKQKIDSQINEFGISYKDYELLSFELNGLIRSKANLEQQYFLLAEKLKSKTVSINETKKDNKLKYVLFSVISVASSLIMFALTREVITGVLGLFAPIIINYVLKHYILVDRSLNDKNKDYYTISKNINEIVAQINKLNIERAEIFKKVNVPAEEVFYEKKNVLLSLMESKKQVEEFIGVQVKYFDTLDRNIINATEQEGEHDVNINESGNVKNNSVVEKSELLYKIDSIDQVDEVLEKKLKQKSEMKNKLYKYQSLFSQHKLQHLSIIEQEKETKKELFRLRKSRDEILQNQSESFTKARQLNVAVDQLKSSEEELLNAKQELDKSYNDLRTLEVVEHYATLAYKNISQTTNESIKLHIEKYLPVITSKYRQIRLSNELELELFVKNSWVNAKNYASAGTLTILYTLLRLAIAEIIYDKNFPLVLLDDIFYSLDSKNLTGLLNCLDDFSASTQVIIFVCNDIECSQENLVYQEIKLM